MKMIKQVCVADVARRTEDEGEWVKDRLLLFHKNRISYRCSFPIILDDDVDEDLSSLLPLSLTTPRSTCVLV